MTMSWFSLIERKSNKFKVNRRVHGSLIPLLVSSFVFEKRKSGNE